MWTLKRPVWPRRPGALHFLLFSAPIFDNFLYRDPLHGSGCLHIMDDKEWCTGIIVNGVAVGKRVILWPASGIFFFSLSIIPLLLGVGLLLCVALSLCWGWGLRNRANSFRSGLSVSVVTIVLSSTMYLSFSKFFHPNCVQEDENWNDRWLKF